MGSEFVFGYGSLSEAAHVVACLAGARRVWDVAMDNLETVPGYKYYVDPVSGERPDVCVTFLDVDLDAAGGVDCVGFLLPVAGRSALAALDRRERNYDRVEVTTRITPEPGGDQLDIGRVWTYIAKPEARERYRVAAAAGRAVIQSAYLAGVEAAYAARGLSERYAASTREPGCPLADLRRVNESSRV